MDYTEIKNAAYGYADRTDKETIDMYDKFLPLVESRINRYLKTMDMTASASIPSIDDNVLYPLPADFKGLRNIQILGADSSGSNKTVTAELKTPAQVAEFSNMSETARPHKIYYSIQANQLHIEPQLNNRTIDLLYYQKVPPLTLALATNWLGDEYPDCYVFGVLVEISSFAKDPDSASLWNTRFDSALLEIKKNDEEERWGSSDSLQIRTV